MLLCPATSSEVPGFFHVRPAWRTHLEVKLLWSPDNGSQRIGKRVAGDSESEGSRRQIWPVEQEADRRHVPIPHVVDRGVGLALR